MKRKALIAVMLLAAVALLLLVATPIGLYMLLVPEIPTPD